MKSNVFDDLIIMIDSHIFCNLILAMRG